MRIRAYNFLLALLQMEKRCWSKLSSESIVFPSKVSIVLVVSETSPIDTLKGVFVLRSKCLVYSFSYVLGQVQHVSIHSEIHLYQYSSLSVCI